MLGKPGTAPCGHPGEHIFPGFVVCLQKCDVAPKSGYELPPPGGRTVAAPWTYFPWNIAPVFLAETCRGTCYSAMVTTEERAEWVEKRGTLSPTFSWPSPYILDYNNSRWKIWPLPEDEC